jgi:hypothetical protein
VPLPMSSGLWRGVGNFGELMHTLMLIFRYSKSMQEEISILCSLTKNLQLKRSSLDAERVRKKGGLTQRALN